MPMGWTHALAFCQIILSQLARGAAPLSLVLEDNLPAPRLDPPVLSVYVDNFATIGTKLAHVREVGHAFLNRAHTLGWKTHECSIDSGKLGLLDSYLTLGSSGLKCGATEALAATPRTPQDRPRFQSWYLRRCWHLTSLATVRRERLSVCRAVCVFAGKQFPHRHCLWPAVRQELEWMRISLHGVVTRRLSLGVRTLARRVIVDTFCQEKGEDAVRSVHERIMNGRTFLNPVSVILLILALDGSLFDAHWRVLFSSRSRKEHVTVLEARSVSIRGRCQMCWRSFWPPQGGVLHVGCVPCHSH